MRIRRRSTLHDFALAAVLCTAMAGAASVATTTTAAELHGLSSRDLQLRPVRIRGVVTYVDHAAHTLFIQNDSGAAVLQFADEPDYRPGDVLDVNGVAIRLDGVPVVEVADARKVGRRPLPAAIHVVTDTLMTGRYEGQLICIEGIVWSSSIVENTLQLRLGLAAGLVKLDIVSPAPDTPAVPVDAKVLVEGVLARTVNRNGQLVGFRVLAPDVHMIKVVSPAPADPFAMPAKPIDRLVRLTPDATGGHRVKLSGTVTRHSRGTSVFLRDTTGAFHVHTRQDLTLPPGTRIEAVGFLAPPEPDEYSPFLENATVRIVGTEPPPRPVAVTAQSIRDGEHDSDLVEVAGRVVDVDRRRTSYRVTLRGEDGGFFAAQVSAGDRVPALEGLRPDSDVRVVGTVSIDANSRTQPTGFDLRTRTVDDFVIVKHAAAPWALRHVLWGLGVVLAIAGVGAMWIAVLRRQVQRQTARVREQLEAEAALKQRYHDLFENANDAIFILAADLALKAANRTARALMGLGPDETLVGSINDLVAPEATELTVAHLTAARDGLASTFRSEILNRAGRRVPVEVSARAILEGGVVVGLQCIARDLSERQHLEDQLRQSQKMEAVGQLAGGIAHDFNNLITVMLGQTELIQTQPDDRDLVAAGSEAIRIAAERAAGLTQQLLAFSRRQHLKPKVLDLNDVLTTIERLIRSLLGERYELHVQRAPELARIKADPHQISQIVINLAANARDAMSQGGIVRMETSNVRLRRAATGHDGRIPAGSYVLLSIADDGCGMTEDVLRHIFEPFFTTKEVGKGTGLGLATVYGIVRQSGAFIDVVSRPGVGSAFRIYFPSVDEEPVSAGVDSRPRLDTPAKETVMLVEDETAVQHLVASALRRQGYRVLTASNGKDALDLLTASNGRLDLLISDVVMPQIGGCELAERASALQPDLKVLLMTGYSDSSVLDRAIASGRTMMMKPFTLEDLLHKTRSLLDETPAAA